MNLSWPELLLDGLERVDLEEAPHGLYGVQKAHAPEGPFPTLAQVLGAPNMVGLVKKCGLANPSVRPRSENLSFNAGGERVDLRILNHATTKVRHYGSAFRLDPRHVKPSREPDLDLESLIPKLARRYFAPTTHSILLVAHTVSKREIEVVLGKTVDPAFVERYGLAHHSREWDDRYARAFRTSLHLWVARPLTAP